MDHDDLIDEWERAWSGRDPAAFGPLCAPQVHYEDPLTDLPLLGAAALGEHAQRLWDGFPDVRVEGTGARLTDGRYVAAPCRVLGTHRRSFAGVPATGRTITAHGVFYCQVERGRLLRVRGFFDVCCRAGAHSASGRCCWCAGSACAPAVDRSRPRTRAERGEPGPYLVTTSVPAIPGWMVQTYWMVPAFVALKE